MLKIQDFSFDNNFTAIHIWYVQIDKKLFSKNSFTDLLKTMDYNVSLTHIPG